LVRPITGFSQAVVVVSWLKSLTESSPTIRSIPLIPEMAKDAKKIAKNKKAPPNFQKLPPKRLDNFYKNVS